jgi:hypothetical protein
LNANDFGLACNFVRPEPAQARPKPWLSGQARPAHHYLRQNNAAKKFNSLIYSDYPAKFLAEDPVNPADGL